MSKIAIISTIGVVVVGGALILNTSNKTSNDQGVEQEESLSSFNGSTRELLALGKKAHCTVTHTDQNGTVNGEVFIDGEQFRGDFTVNYAGQNLTNSIIHNNGTGYMWGTSPFGNMALMFDVENEGDDDNQKNQGFDLNENVEFNCESWNPDPSYFEPPSDIEFSENLSLTGSNDIPGAAMPGGADLCSACANLPAGEQQDQCKLALSCQ